MSAKRFWSAVTVGIVVIAYASGAVLYQYTTGDAHLYAKLWLVVLLATSVFAVGINKVVAKLIETKIPEWAQLILSLTATLGIVVAFTLLLFLLP